MLYEAKTVRELIQAAIVLTQGNYPREAHDRFVELMGASIGDIRHNSQFGDAVLVEFATDGTIDAFRRIDPLVRENVFKQFREKNPETHVEVWGWPWKWTGRSQGYCLHSANRPKDANVIEPINAAYAVFQAAEQSFAPNEFQKIAARSYGEGDFAHLADITGHDEFKQALNQVGDTLFRFIMTELGDNEGCDNPEEATSRMLKASEEVREIADDLFTHEQEQKPAI